MLAIVTMLNINGGISNQIFELMLKKITIKIQQSNCYLSKRIKAKYAHQSKIKKRI